MAAMMQGLGMNLSNLLFNLTFVLRKPCNCTPAGPEEFELRSMVPIAEKPRESLARRPRSHGGFLVIDQSLDAGFLAVLHQRKQIRAQYLSITP